MCPELTPADYLGYEILIPRVDGERTWNEYCAVVGETEGALLVDVPGEDKPIKRSLHSLDSGLGAEERPLSLCGSAACAAARSATS